MWETIKNDPILKTTVVIVLGVLAFGFAFNIMFGASGGGMGSEMGGGYSLQSTLANATSVLIKILLIAVLIAAIVGVVKFLKNYLIGGKEIKISDTVYKNSYTKIIVGIVGVLLILTLISGITYGTLTILLILTKTLLMISVIGLVVGIVMYLLQTRGDEKLKVKLNILSSEKCASCGTKVGKEFKFCPNCSVKIKKECVKCKTQLKNEWTCCPVCGDEKAMEIKDIIDEGVKETIIENISENASIEINTSGEDVKKVITEVVVESANENVSIETNALSLDEKKVSKKNDNVSKHRNAKEDIQEGQVVDIKKDEVN